MIIAIRNRLIYNITYSITNCNLVLSKMDKYIVRLLNPQDKEVILLERVIEYNGTLGARPYYEVKKKFYEEACSVMPGLRSLSISVVFNSVSVKGLTERYKSKVESEKALRNSFKSLEAWQKVSNVSVDKELIPYKCPICKNEPIVNNGRFFVLHHWGPYDKLTSIESGFYRRMCRSCNSYLGSHLDIKWIYSKEATWDIQYRCLVERFEANRKSFPSFDGVEEVWSKFLFEETKIFEGLLNGLEGNGKSKR